MGKTEDGIKRSLSPLPLSFTPLPLYPFTLYPLPFTHSPEPDRTIFLIAILTGMRKGEVLALQWGDVDWNSDTIYVRRSLRFKMRKDIDAEDKRWWFDSPKTKYSTRAIIMSPHLKEALENHRFNQTGDFAQKDKSKKPLNTDELIFTNGAGCPVDPDNIVKRKFHPALERAGLRKIRFHDLRHTFASLLIDQGENIKFIQSQLSHASIQTTLDRYGHLLPLKNYIGVGRRLDEKVFSSKEINIDNVSNIS